MVALKARCLGVTLSWSHACAARHGGAFFWSFAQKMAPKPCGFKVMFQLAEHGGSDA
jgi:hypothetical protein